MKAVLSIAILLALTPPTIADVVEKAFGVWRLRTRTYTQMPPETLISVSTFALDPPQASIAFVCAKKGPIFQKQLVVGAKGFANEPSGPASLIEIKLAFDTGLTITADARLGGPLATVFANSTIDAAFRASLDARLLDIQVGDDHGPVNVAGFAPAAIAFGKECDRLYREKSQT